MTFFVLFVCSTLGMAGSLALIATLVAPAAIAGRKPPYVRTLVTAAALSIILGVVVAMLVPQRVGDTVAKIEADTGVKITDHPGWVAVLVEGRPSQAWVFNGARWDCEITDSNDATLKCLPEPVEVFSERVHITDLDKGDAASKPDIPTLPSAMRSASR